MISGLLIACGVFSITLGVVHFFLPFLFDFKAAIPRDDDGSNSTLAPLKPLRFLIFTYATTRSDVHGIAWVMNHAASYVLVSIGVADLFAPVWVDRDWAWLLLAWMAGWWFLRAGCQLYLGRSRGNWLVLSWFSLLGIVHLAACIGTLF